MMLRMLTNSTSNGIADQHFVQQHFPAGVVVAVDEARHHGHALGVEGLRVLAARAF